MVHLTTMGITLNQRRVNTRLTVFTKLGGSLQLCEVETSVMP